MIKKLIFGLSFLALATAMPIMAQVTIGSGQAPMQGALLDLKEKSDGTSTRGLNLPRVKLTSNNDIINGDISDVTAANKDAHIGLIVYNTGEVTTSVSTRLCPGLHVWNGDKWQSLKPYPDWSATPPAVVGTPVVEIVSRTSIVDPLKPIGHIGYLEDIRGIAPSWEYNRYAYARFYTYKIIIKTTTDYMGQDSLACVVKNKTWTEVINTDSIEEGIFMTQNMNTRYFPDNTLINGGVPSATGVATNAQFAYPQSAVGAIQALPTNYWDKSQGLLYNYKAAVNKDIGNVNEGGTAHEVRQGICPTGWHVPSDMEYTAFTAALGGDAVAGTALKSLTRLAGTVTDITNASSASADMGGFNMLLACYANTGTVYNYGLYGYLWSSSSSSGTVAWYRYVGNAAANVTRLNGYNRSLLFSVRCKKD